MHVSRRTFLRSSAAATFGASMSPMIFANGHHSPNDDIRVAVIGIKSRGGAHINGLHSLDGVRVVALCDADEAFLARDKKKFEDRGEKVDTEVDLRRILDRDDIDAIATATPNHWHALITVWACQAGKDVYVEKPVSHNVWEGRQMVNAARAYGRIVQTGTQSRSSHAMTEAIEWVKAGGLGALEYAHGTCFKPRQSIGKVDGPQKPPASLDYDLWTGPAPMKPLERRNLHYDWHWVFDTGNGDLGNQGVHQVDMCRWGLGHDTLPKRVISIGGRFGYDDDGNTPNTQLMWLDYDDCPILFEVRGLPRDKAAQSSGWGGGMDRVNGMAVGATIHCENGTLHLPNYNSAIARDLDGNEVRKWNGASSHFANFIDAMRSRKPSDLTGEILEGHLSAAMCHLGNISYQVGRNADPEVVRSLTSASNNPILADSYERLAAHLDANEVDLSSHRPTVGAALEFDPDNETFIDNDEANALLTREYREPFVVPAVG